MRNCPLGARRLFCRIGLLVTLSASTAVASGAGASIAEIALADGTAAYLRGDYQAAARVLEAAATDKSNDRSDSALSVLVRLSSIYSMQGRYREAESALGQALVGTRQVHGDRHASSGTLLRMLGNVLREQGRYEESETAYLRALRVLQPVYGIDHPEAAECLSGLAELSRLLGNNEESQRRFWRAYMVSSYLYGGDSSKVGDLLTKLSKVYLSQGRNREAEDLIARALEIGDRPLQANRPWDRLDDRDLLLLLPSEREYSATRGQLVVKTKDSEHPEYARYFDYQAELYLAAGRYADSENSFRRSIAIRERAFGRDHPEVIGAHAGLALARALRGDHQGALALTRSATAASAKRISAYSIEDAHYAQGERRHWRFAFLQLLSLLNAKPPGPEQSVAESFEAMQYANPFNAAEAASEMASRFAAGNEQLATRIRAEVGTQKPMTIGEVQQLLKGDEGVVVYVQGTDETYVALVRKGRVDFRAGRTNPQAHPLSLLQPELAGLRKVVVVTDRADTHLPFPTLPSVASLRAFPRSD